MTEPASPAQAAPGGTPGNQGLSLKRQLLLWLLLPQLVLLLVGGALAYRVALNYAEKAIDQSLTQSVKSLSRQVKPIGSGLLIDFPRAAQDIIEQDPTDRVSYMVSSPPGSFLLGNAKIPPPVPAVDTSHAETLLYNTRIDGKPMRVALLELDYGEPNSPQRLRVQVAKSLAVQQRLTTELIADMLLPLLLLGAVLSILMYAGILRGLQPLTRLQAQLGKRRAPTLAALSPIELTQAPQEVYALATALNQLLSAVRRSLGQEKRFLNDAAHQLRTPLAGLISQTELALTETDPQALRARLTKVLSGAQRSAHLVHQLLSLARNEVEVKLQPLDVAALAREVARDWTPRAVRRNIDLGFEGADHLLVDGVALLLREALNNLIDNALTYAGPGSEVTLSANTLEDQVVLEVRDNGAGLSAQDLPHVFERFWRASDVPGGCGLGLAIVKEIARRHGGSAAVLPATPHGLRVQLQLPRFDPALTK
ncbi:sensor histidine kinase [Rhodoferax antarcticus]|uniref:sensor histidine kinase n=1 Tax=Rhodoferax antarcticus TaxID=81479 RepID=UPI002224CA1C|nr:sensor histidine kinase [Rhodoferax antarcticus]MCW2313799.1 two-component system sensor histidine kinase TctE [Rhodoferax antarcticus]